MLLQDMKFALLTHPDVITSLGSSVAVTLQERTAGHSINGQLYSGLSSIDNTWLQRWKQQPEQPQLGSGDMIKTYLKIKICPDAGYDFMLPSSPMPAVALYPFT